MSSSTDQCHIVKLSVTQYKVECHVVNVECHIVQFSATQSNFSLRTVSMDTLIHIVFYQASLKFLIKILSLHTRKPFLMQHLLCQFSAPVNFHVLNTPGRQGWSCYLRPQRLVICTRSCRSQKIWLEYFVKRKLITKQTIQCISNYSQLYSLYRLNHYFITYH